MSRCRLLLSFAFGARRSVRMLAALCLAVVLGAHAAAAGDAIRVAFVSSSLVSIPLVLADAKGFFRAQGLDATLIPFESAQPIAVAIAGGDADFGSTGLTNAFFVLANQGALRIIGGATVEHPGFHSLGVIVSNQAHAAGLKSYAEFAGRSVGITQIGSPLQYALACVVQKYGVDMKTVRVVGLQSNANVASAITGGQIDASVMSSANLYAVVNRGGARLLGWVEDEVHGTQVSGTFTATKLANDRPETVRRFLVAFRKAAQAWNAAFLDANGNRADQPDAPEMIALMAKGLNQPPDVITRALNYLEPEARVAVDDIQRMLDWYEAQGMQKIHIDARSMVDLRYAKLVGDE